MTEKKPAKRAVSKPRLLKATVETMKEHELNTDDPCGKLLDAIRADIVAAAVRDLTCTCGRTGALYEPPVLLLR